MKSVIFLSSSLSPLRLRKTFKGLLQISLKQDKNFDILTKIELRVDSVNY